MQTVALKTALNKFTFIVLKCLKNQTFIQNKRIFAKRD